MIARLKRRLIEMLALVVIGLLGWWGYTTFLAPSDAVVVRSRVTAAATEHLMKREWDAALAAVEDGLSALPGDWELLVWQSALLEKLGRPGNESLAQAEAQVSPTEVWITLGMVTLMTEEPDKVLAVGEKLVERAPDIPHGYFFLAQAYDLRDQPDDALRAYREAEKRAADNPDYSGMYVAVRERIYALTTLPS